MRNITLEDVHRSPIFQAWNPEGKQFMEACWLPPKLNPFAEHGISVAALISFSIFPHIKTLPVVQMMLEDFLSDRYVGKHTIVVPSSGNTAHAVARLAPTFGFTKVKAVMSNDVPDSKSSILRAFGSPVDVMQVGDVAGTAREEARKVGHYHLDQYGHMGNPHAHLMCTGLEILRVLGDTVAVVAIAMGSGGTACGVGRFFRAQHPETFVLGVRPALGQQVPGARDCKKMEEVVKLPWREVVDGVIEIGRKESFIRTRRLWSAVEPQPGPTSGLAWAGLERYLQNLPPEALDKLRGKSVGFICPDDGRFYSGLIMAELDPDQGL